MEEVRIRKVESSGTWYDYKMAFVGTLIDHGLYMVVEGTAVNIKRSSEMFAKSNTTTYVLSRKGKSWKDLYIQELLRVIKGMENHD